MSLVNLIKKIAIEAVRAESPMKFISATVISPRPNLQIRLKQNAKLIIPNDLILVASHLSVSRTSVVINGTSHNIEFNNELKTGDKVMVAVIQGGQSFFIMDRIR